jgi:hypothetical protein
VRKRFVITGVIIAICVILLIAVFAGQSDSLNVTVSDEVKGMMREKGNDLYIFLGRYRGT